jgi:zinc transport system substrate-binding protein
MEPWVADVLKGIDNKNLAIIDSSKGITLLKESDGPGDEHAGADPHLWLDLKNAQEMVDTICAGFIARDPLNKNYYSTNAQIYKSKLALLDKEFFTLLGSCKHNIIVQGGHFAFGYLAKRYHLQYKAAYGFSPNAEPGPRRLYELSEFMKKHGIKYIYYEEMLSPRVAETIARETGATLLKLNAAHNVTREELDTEVSFIAIMQQNLKNLKIGLQCQ